MNDFRGSVLRFISPYLQKQGYAFDDRLMYGGNELYNKKLRNGELPLTDAIRFGYYKHLSKGHVAFIIFERHQQNWRPMDNTFAVFLLRSKPSNIEKWYIHKGNSKYHLPRTNLGKILYFQHKLRVRQHSELWWICLNQDELERSLNETTSYLIDYGIPWLENWQSVSFIQQLEEEYMTFLNHIGLLGLLRLSQKGYDYTIDVGGTGAAFTKSFSGNVRVILHVTISPTIYGAWQPTIHLLRHSEKSTFAVTPSQTDLQITLDDFLITMGFAEAAEPLYSRAYRSAEEREKQVTIIFDQLEERALPWLENPATTLYPSI